MYVSPNFVRSLHFVGIGGIGMSGIAEILHNQGYSVRGSDLVENANIQRLKSIGIPVVIGHKKENIRGVQAVVVSTAIPQFNSEILAAREYGIPIITRGEMLAEVIRLKKSIAVSGSHGKTTTTSLIASVLSEADLDPTIINGGIINTYHTNAKLGHGEWMVVEADESDGSFLKLPSVINIITNIDVEHMSYYKTVDNLRAAFTQFIKNLPFYGLGVICSDHPSVQEIFSQPVDRRCVTYGLTGEPNFKGENIRFLNNGMLFDVVMTKNVSSILRKVAPDISQPHMIHDVFLPMYGTHNILNALAAIAVANELGIDIEVVKRSFSAFLGVKRRFTILGVMRGVTFVDDYAHHPTEIQAVMNAARKTAAKRLIVIFQPHRYTRFSSLWNEFLTVLAQADVVIIPPVYPAGEAEIPGITNENFVEVLHKSGKQEAYAAKSYDETLQYVQQIAQENDFVIGMGAGNISEWMHQIYKAF